MKNIGILDGYNDVLTPDEVQKILQTGRNTVYEYLAAGRIRSIRIGGKYRIPKLYLVEFLYPDMDMTTPDKEDLEHESA